ncbi:YkgJ family cysteine cluster protein [Desulfogranum japonicum]|uniref:YkgJ family cysteine cluster protein n=1 Tax=Desulfogranum japonicum TaxID=231447 RepID=UPI000683E735|nr:YkgJ family cysteine cluster protein [Desulfogranum japonicum]
MKPPLHENTLQLSQSTLQTMFHECRQCGTCCKSYRKITLQPDEVDFIKKMGGHVGVDVSLNELRTKTMDELVEKAKASGKVFMIHPDDKGCVFLEKRNSRYYCKIYHYRPQSCKGFRCNLADNSLFDLVGRGAIHLLGQNTFGQPLQPK